MEETIRCYNGSGEYLGTFEEVFGEDEEET